MSTIPDLLKGTLSGLLVHLSASTQDYSKAVLDRELPAHWEIGSCTLSMFQEFLKCKHTYLTFIFKHSYSFTLLFILLTFKRYFPVWAAIHCLML